LSRRPFYLRALLSSAALAASLVLAGCDSDGIAPSGRANAPLSDKMLAELEAKQMDKGSPILVRLFKEEAEAEVWKKNRNGEFALLKTYPICRWSGELGPKVKEGDRQAPEGFYTITPGLMNPNSNYYLAFNTGYPNAFDRAWGRTGSELMVHGDCSSRGCYAMTDEQMVEIYALARESFFGGQKSFQLQAYPFRMTARNLAKHRNSPHLAFWKNLKEGYDHFEVTKQEPKVDVCERRYVFDAASPENASRPLAFNARGKCPAYEIPKEIAELVQERTEKDNEEFRELVASNIATAPVKRGVDGGMNPVFLAHFQGPSADNNGRIVGTELVAMHTPGALPRTPNNPPAQTVPPIQVANAEPANAEPAPVVAANVPVPRTAPQAKEGEAPSRTGIAGLIDNIFSGSSDETKPAEPAQAAPIARPARTAVAAAKPAKPVTHTLAAARQQPKPADQQVASRAPTPELRPRLKEEVASAAQQPKPPEPAHEMRTAFTTPAQPGLMTGAQPVMPSGSFESRWSAFR
jgi:murein L,D-transpeptidase YafK